MFTLLIEYDDGRMEEYFFDTKEEVDEEVEFRWTEDAVFSVGIFTSDISLVIFWEDRYQFGW